MSEQAASQAEAVDVFSGQTPTLDEYNTYRQSGEVPERFKTAEPAGTAPDPDKPETSPEGDKPESAPDSDPDDQQQEKAKPKHQTASERVAKLNEKLEELWAEEDPDLVKIAQITATIEKIDKGAQAKRKTEVAPVAEESRPQAPSQTYQDWEKAFNPDNWMEEYAKAHPDDSYDRAHAAMFSHMMKVRDQFAMAEQQRAEQVSELTAKVDDARERYGEKFDEVVWPTLQTIVSDDQINPTVKAMFNDSDVVAHLLFTIGSDEAEMAKFLQLAKSDPGKAIRYVAAVEAGINEELSSQGNQADRNDKGQFAAKEPPAKPKTSAPKPPSPVTGASSGAFDVSDESLSADEWMRKRNSELSGRKA